VLKLINTAQKVNIIEKFRNCVRIPHRRIRYKINAVLLTRG